MTLNLPKNPIPKRGVDQISASDPKPGPSKQSDLQKSPSINHLSSKPSAELMETIQRFKSEIPSDPNSKQSECFAAEKKTNHSDKRKHKSRAKYVPSSSSSEESEASVQVKKSSKPKGASSEQDKQKSDPDPVLYQKVDMSDLPSQYTENIETIKQILNISDPRDNMPRSSTTVWALNDAAGQQELRPRGPSAMLPLSPQLKDDFDKFEQDSEAANLPKGKYVKPPASSSKWYKFRQTCFEDNLQELNTNFAKICISPRPSGAPLGKVPLPVVKEFEHQERPNVCILNFSAAFTKTASECNLTMEKVPGQYQGYCQKK